MATQIFPIVVSGARVKVAIDAGQMSAARRGSRARHRVAGDLAEFGPAEFDRRGVIRHGVHPSAQGPKSQRGPDRPGSWMRRSWLTRSSHAVIADGVARCTMAHPTKEIASARSSPPPMRTAATRPLCRGVYTPVPASSVMTGPRRSRAAMPPRRARRHRRA